MRASDAGGITLRQNLNPLPCENAPVSAVNSFRRSVTETVSCAQGQEETLAVGSMGRPSSIGMEFVESVTVRAVANRM